MQVDPIKPKLKLPGTKRWKLNCDGRLSKFAFKINLHPYNVGEAAQMLALGRRLHSSTFQLNLSRF